MTRVYQYGLLDPVVNAELVDRQMWLAHRYRNTLIEIERERRTGARAILGAHGDVEPIEREIAALVTEMDAARLSIKTTRSASRSRSESPDARSSVRDLAARVRVLRGQVKAAKSIVRTDPIIAEGLRVNEERSRARVREARAACGVYWGTYLLAEQASDMARAGKMDPSFQRWTGSGRVSVQVQGGMGVEDLFGDDHTLIRIAPIDPVAYLPETSRGQHRRLTRTTLRLRVGSDGRAPVWAEWPMIMHRELPRDGRIKVATVHRRRRDCRRWEWTLSLTVDDSASPPREAPAAGACALNLGWCRRYDGSLRAGYLVGDDGHEDEIVVPVSILDRQRKAESLRSIRDHDLDACRPALSAWLASIEGPDEFRTRIASLGLWKSPARFASLARWWRANRFDGDQVGYEMLEAWRYRDEHLQRYEAGLARAGLHRRELYRIVAAAFARRYRTLVVDDVDLRDTQRSPRTEDDRVDIDAVKWQQRVASPSELRAALINAFGKERIVVVPVGDVTRTCNACGVIDTAWQRGPSDPREHACSTCGAIWDQDANACRNLLALRERSDAGEDGETARAAMSAPRKPSRSDRLRAARLARGGAETARATPGNDAK